MSSALRHASMLLRGTCHLRAGPGGWLGAASTAASGAQPSAAAVLLTLLPPSAHRPRFSTSTSAQASPSSSAPGPSTSDAEGDRVLATLRDTVQLAAGPNFALYDDLPAFLAAADIEASAYAALEARLGHAWARPWLLRAALVHSSFQAETSPSGTQSLLAWLGDAALQSITTDELVARYGASGARPPAQLTVTRSLITSRAGCARHARALGLGGLGPGRLVCTGDSFRALGMDLSTGMLGECFEAVLGSVYLDGGRGAARDAFLRLDPFPATIAEVPGIYAALMVQKKLLRSALPLESETGYVMEAPATPVEVREEAAAVEVSAEKRGGGEGEGEGGGQAR